MRFPGWCIQVRAPLSEYHRIAVTETCIMLPPPGALEIRVFPLPKGGSAPLHTASTQLSQAAGVGQYSSALCARRYELWLLQYTNNPHVGCADVSVFCESETHLIHANENR